MATFFLAQNTVNTKGMTCAFWGRNMPCKNGDNCKYAHERVGRLADLPRRDEITGLSLAGRNQWQFVEAQEQARANFQAAGLNCQRQWQMQPQAWKRKSREEPVWWLAEPRSAHAAGQAWNRKPKEEPVWWNAPSTSAYAEEQGRIRRQAWQKEHETIREQIRREGLVKEEEAREERCKQKDAEREQRRIQKNSNELLQEQKSEEQQRHDRQQQRARQRLERDQLSPPLNPIRSSSPDSVTSLDLGVPLDSGYISDIDTSPPHEDVHAAQEEVTRRPSEELYRLNGIYPFAPPPPRLTSMATNSPSSQRATHGSSSPASAYTTSSARSPIITILSRPSNLVPNHRSWVGARIHWSHPSSPDPSPGPSSSKDAHRGRSLAPIGSE